MRVLNIAEWTDKTKGFRRTLGGTLIWLTAEHGMAGLPQSSNFDNQCDKRNESFPKVGIRISIESLYHGEKFRCHSPYLYKSY